MARRRFGDDDAWSNPQAYALAMPDPGMDRQAFQMRNRHAVGDYSGVMDNNNGFMEKTAGAITRGIAPLRRIADQGLFGNGPAPRLFSSRAPQPMMEQLQPQPQASYDRIPTGRNFAPSGWDEGPPEPVSGLQPRQFGSAPQEEPQYGYASRGSVAPAQQGFLSDPALQQELAGNFVNAGRMYNQGMESRRQMLGRFHDFNNHDMNRALAADTWGSIGDIANLFGNSGMSSGKGYQEYRQRLNDVANRQALNNQYTDDSGARQKDIFNMLSATDPTTIANQTKMANAMANQYRAGAYGRSVDNQGYTGQYRADTDRIFKGIQGQHMMNQDALGNAKLTELMRQHDLVNQIAQRKVAQGDLAGAQKAQQIADQIRKTAIYNQQVNQQGQYQNRLADQGDERNRINEDNNQLDFLSQTFGTDSANWRADQQQQGIDRRAAGQQIATPTGQVVPKMSPEFIKGAKAAPASAKPVAPKMPAKSVTKASELKPLTPEVVQMAKAQYGDKAKAMEALRQLGYQVK